MTTPMPIYMSLLFTIVTALSVSDQFQVSRYSTSKGGCLRYYFKIDPGYDEAIAMASKAHDAIQMLQKPLYSLSATEDMNKWQYYLRLYLALFDGYDGSLQDPESGLGDNPCYQQVTGTYTLVPPHVSTASGKEPVQQQTSRCFHPIRRPTRPHSWASSTAASRG